MNQEKEILSSIDVNQLKITSSAFEENGLIPSKYTCDGNNISPSLTIENIPKESKSLSIIVEDPDAPVGTWVHWVIWNIPVTGRIKENQAPGVQGINDFRKNNYGGPCPPNGTHRYFFKVFALDTVLELPANTNKHMLEKAMVGHIIASGQLVGLYTRQ
jgi:Raf kinase inhibitor-like YbhB/YbcL family protein